MSRHHEILQSVANGNQEAFQQLYGLFSENVYNTALSYAQNKQDAEEITQDIFVKIFNQASTFKGNATVSTWIYRITVNTSLNFIKKNKRYTFLRLSEQEKDKPDFDHPGILLEKKEHAKILFKAIDTLGTQQKTAFILSFIEGLPRQEVADIMEISLKAVESLLQRAKKNLRQELNYFYLKRRKND